MQHVKQKDGGDGSSIPPGALLRADSHRLLAGESSHCASAQAGGGRPSSMTDFMDAIARLPLKLLMAAFLSGLAIGLVL